MAQNQSSLAPRSWHHVLFIILLAVGGFFIAGGVATHIMLAGTEAGERWEMALQLTALFGIALVVAGAVGYPVAHHLAGMRDAAEQHRHDGEMIRLLRSINERLLLSDTAKRIAYREQDRAALRRAINDDISKGDYEAALAMVEEMAGQYGYREEGEQFRRQILEAREADIQGKIESASEHLDELMKHERWEEAIREASAVARTYPDAPRAAELPKKVRAAFERYKQDMERRFLEAAQQDDVDTAMELLKTLDQYLTESEAGQFREVARGVITKKRENLGVQFKLAVQDREWDRAISVGEDIISDFPNSKMADEVRSMLDTLRERAALARQGA